MSTIGSKIEAKSPAHVQPFMPTADIPATDTQRAIEAVQANATAIAAAQFIVALASGALSGERVATDTATVSWDFATAAQAKANVVDGSITFAKMQDIATNSLIGRDTASSGDPENILLTAPLEMDGALNLRIAANGIADTHIRQSAGLSIIGRSANTTGNVADITGTDGQVLRVSGTALGFGTIATAGIANDAVTFAKMQNIATNSLIGRDTASSGDPENILLTAPLEMDGSLNLRIATNGIANTHIRQGAALSVIGVTGNATANVADIAAANDGEVLRRSGTALAFGTVATAGIADDAVTYAKLQNISAQYRLLGRSSSGAGNAEEITTSSYILTLLDDADAATALGTLTALGQGLHTIWVPAGAMITATTSGAATASLESSTNDVNYKVFDFDASADEHVHFQIAMPKNWDESTITFQVWWTTAGAVTTGVAWGLQAVALSDNTAIDTSWGTPVVIQDDAQSAAGELYITSVSSAVTIGNTPAEGDLVFFRLFRDVSDANDDMTQDARLIGIKIFYTSNAATDA